MQDSSRTLAIETAGEACSVALFDNVSQTLEPVAHDHRILGRGHAEALVPMIAALPERGRASRICVSLGPGSFTGVRIGIAAARALGFAWGAEVLGYPTLALIAAIALDKVSADSVTVCVNGGHGEWFVQNFGPDGPKDEARSLKPDAARDICKSRLIAGNRAAELAALCGKGYAAIDASPDARALPLLHRERLVRALSPIYGRAPDAKPQPSNRDRITTGR